jgi:hypothetical protein
MRTDHGGTKPRVVPARRRFPPTRANSARVPLIDRLDENVPDDNPFIGRKPVGAPREFAGDQIFEGLVIGSSVCGLLGRLAGVDGARRHQARVATRR